MSSYLSSLLTTTTSRYNSLRALLPSGGSDADGDTEDDTHICRVLRAYYVEKGRPFPSWLPPDPKAPQPVQAPQYNTYQPVGAGYGGLANAGTGGNKLGSLWDSQPAPNNPAQQGLRQGGVARGASSLSNLRGGPPNRSLSPQEPVQARPLPSQRAGSYQNAAANTPPGSSGSGAGGTAQDRLKARLWGAAKTAGAPTNNSTPSLVSTVTQAQAQAPPQAPPRGGSSGGGGYDRGGSYGSSGSAGYDGGYGRGRSGGAGSDRPFVAATAPWASNENEFSGGGGFAGYGGSGARQGPASSRQGLPSGPASRRPPGGLPSGPRGMR